MTDSGGRVKDQGLLRILARFLVEGSRTFVLTCLAMMRHPFRYFDDKNPEDPEVVHRALDFFVLSFAAQGVLWFFSMLPELPRSEFVPKTYQPALLFGDLLVSGLIWHLFLRAARRRAVGLKGTIAILLYWSGLGTALIVPYFVGLRVLARQVCLILLCDPVALFEIMLLPFVVFLVCVRVRWMVSYHRVGMLVGFLTMGAADATWAMLREWIVVPWILVPAFSAFLSAYKWFVFTWIVPK